jgi:hypothetical protein
MYNRAISEVLRRGAPVALRQVLVLPENRPRPRGRVRSHFFTCLSAASSKFNLCTCTLRFCKHLGFQNEILRLTTIFDVVERVAEATLSQSVAWQREAQPGNKCCVEPMPGYIIPKCCMAEPLPGYIIPKSCVAEPLPVAAGASRECIPDPARPHSRAPSAVPPPELLGCNGHLQHTTSTSCGSMKTCHPLSSPTRTGSS